MTASRVFAAGLFVFVFSVFNVADLFADAHTVPDAKVFILAGQSNAMGYGSNATLMPEELYPPQTDVRFWYEEGRLPSMTEPCKRLKSDGWEPLKYQTCTTKKIFGMKIVNGFGSEIKLGRVLSDTLEENVFIIKFAFGATSLAQDWNATLPGPLFTDLLRMVDEAMAALVQGEHNPELAGFFWMQGERDGASQQSSANYKKNLEDFIEQIRIELEEPDLPFIIGRLNAEIYNAPFLNVSPANLDAIRMAQEEIAFNTPNVTFVDTDHVPLKQDFHFSARGQVVLGMDFAAAYLSLVHETSVNLTDVLASTLQPGDEIRHTVTGEPNTPYMVLASLNAGPTNTPWGESDLGLPVYLLWSSQLNACGYETLCFDAPSTGVSSFSFLTQALIAYNEPVWAQCGNPVQHKNAVGWTIF